MSNQRMSDSQEAHLDQIKQGFSLLVDSKYRKGAAEHGGDLQDINKADILEMAIEEAVDQVVYLLTLREKLLAEELDKFVGTIPADHGAVIYHNGYDTKTA